MTPDFQPEHMDRWSRNERLYQTLKGMGLFVSPILDERGIDSLLVSTDLPQKTVPVAEADVCAPVERAEIVNGIRSALGHGDNVVDFPTVV